MDDLDIWRSANRLVDLYGDDATIHAAMRADELLAQGDMDGTAIWCQIIEGKKRAAKHGTGWPGTLAAPGY